MNESWEKTKVETKKIIPKSLPKHKKKKILNTTYNSSKRKKGRNKKKKGISSNCKTGFQTKRPTLCPIQCMKKNGITKAHVYT